ncbi:class II fumarate hydratase [Lentisphaera marina]|uniref:class II fumarate hydratase n=1 Tax=Lentisphaera marina TaxID=1111041 RepID=UPI00236688F8|nr:class II fumarate hydratase [Lentisphaera marina]MDD7984424.1 class II fumarate hydratase [Lentisphaera marina]
MKKKNPHKEESFRQNPDKLWGTQTQLCLEHFRIGPQVFPACFIKALVSIKRACAEVNESCQLLDSECAEAIVNSCNDILEGAYSEQFPLSVWQTGSGTQTNMNVNEVICTLANNMLLAKHCDLLIHANDHVNMSQSSNDVFPTAMHISVAEMTQQKLFKNLTHLDQELAAKQEDFKEILTVGRTHLMDALPLTMGDIISAHRAQLSYAQKALNDSLKEVYFLAIGGTAVGNGANAPAGFGTMVCRRLSESYTLPFKLQDNLFAAVCGEDVLLRHSGAVKQLAAALLKMANDFRLLGSGPRCGFNEWRLSANEAGSSIMPGKVNPTQCEALSMVCLQVFGNDLSISLGASQGQLQLNTYRPLIIHNLLESIALLTDAMDSFATHCVRGLSLNESQIAKNVKMNLSAITLLAPKIGYDQAAEIVKAALAADITLAEAAVKLNVCSPYEWQQLIADAMKGLAAHNQYGEL